MEPRQTPTYEANVPEDLSGDGGMACELATAYFGDPLPWQPHLLDAMLARDARDKYLLRTLGISIPRQNGCDSSLNIWSDVSPCWQVYRIF